MVSPAGLLAARAADLIDAKTGGNNTVVVLHSGAVQAAEIALLLQERGSGRLLQDGSVEFVHRSGGTGAIGAALTHIASRDPAPPSLLTIHAPGLNQPPGQRSAECSVPDDQADWASRTCLFEIDHAAAGLGAVIRHETVWVDDVEVSTAGPEGRLLLLDLLLEQVDTDGDIRRLAQSPALADLARAAVEKLVERRSAMLAARLHVCAQPGGPPDTQLACEAVIAEIGRSEGQIDKLLATLVPRLGARVLLEDRAFRPVAWSPRADPPPSLADLLTAKRLSRVVEQLTSGVAEYVRLGTPAAGRRLIMQIGSDPGLGFVSVISPNRDEKTAALWLTHAGAALAAWLVRDSASNRLRLETRGQIVTLLTHGMLSPGSAQLALEEVMGNGGVRVAAISTRPGHSREQLIQRMRVLNAPHGECQGMPVALLDISPDAPEQFRRSLDPVQVQLGLGSTVAVAAELPRSARQAVWACRIALTTRRPILDFAGIGVHRLLLPGAEGGDAEFEEPIRLIEEAGDVLGFDGLHTLTGYLDSGGNMRRAARELAVHVNTLRYRMQRIDRIIHVDLTDPEQRFRLQLAARLRAGRKAMHEQQ